MARPGVVDVGWGNQNSGRASTRVPIVDGIEEYDRIGFGWTQRDLRDTITD